MATPPTVQEVLDAIEAETLLPDDYAWSPAIDANPEDHKDKLQKGRIIAAYYLTGATGRLPACSFSGSSSPLSASGSPSASSSSLGGGAVLPKQNDIELWLDPAEGMYADVAKTTPITTGGVGIELWEDKVNNYKWQYDPSYTTPVSAMGGAGINNKLCCNFTGNSVEFLYIPNPSVDAPQIPKTLDFTIAGVYYKEDTARDLFGLCSSSAQLAPYGPCYNHSNGTTYLNATDSGQSTVYNLIDEPLIPVVYVTRWNSVAGNFDLWKNGVKQTLTFQGNYSNSYTSYYDRIGMRPGFNSAKGKLGDQIAWKDVDLTDKECRDISYYLMDKYNIGAYSGGFSYGFE